MGDEKIPMMLQEAEALANEVIEKLKQHFTKYLIVGSIRRKKPTVGDIDILVIEKPGSEYQFGDETLEATIRRIADKNEGKPNIEKMGTKIKVFFYKNTKVELWIANEKNWDCLKLIRTGSIGHNVRLTTLARMKGLKLFASGEGLCKIKGGMYNNEPEEIVAVIADTEDGILQNLLGRIPPPEKRIDP